MYLWSYLSRYPFYNHKIKSRAMIKTVKQWPVEHIAGGKADGCREGLQQRMPGKVTDQSCLVPLRATPAECDRGQPAEVGQ